MPKNNNVAQDQDQGKTNLYVSVNTFNAEGKTVGERIVDMYHFGTRNWMQNHCWWAMHNGHDVEVKIATPEQIDSYIEASKAALAAKFNGDGGGGSLQQSVNDAPAEQPAAAPAKKAKVAA